METDSFEDDEWDDGVEWSGESGDDVTESEEEASSVHSDSSYDEDTNAVKEELQSEKTKETIDRTRSISPFLSWVLGYSMYLTKELWFLIPALAVGLVVAGLFTGFGTIIDSLMGLVWGGKSILDAGAENPEYVFGGFLFVYGYFLWRIEMWNKQNIPSSVVRETLKMAILVTPLAGFVSYSLFIGGVSGEQAEALYTVSLVAYTVIGWMGGSTLWKLTYYDESTLRLMPPKFITVWLSRVGAATAGYIFLVGVPEMVPVIGVSLAVMVTPLAMWGYLGWRLIRVRQKDSSSNQDTGPAIDIESETDEVEDEEPDSVEPEPEPEPTPEPDVTDSEPEPDVQLAGEDSKWKYE